MTAEPGPGLEYHRLHTAGRSGWGPSLVGVLAVGVLVVVVAPVVVSLAFVAGYAVLHPSGDAAAFADRMAGEGPVTPARLAYVSLALAAAIPVVMIVTRWVHDLRPGWVASIRPRVRWTWLLGCLAISVLALGITLVVAGMLPSSDTGAEPLGEVNDFTTTTRDFLLVVLVLTPLQAVGEEYAFRGYLTQAFGGLFGSRVLAVVLPALLFALAHGTQDPPIFVDRFAFGLLAGVLVIATGGLEAGIAMHVVNNFLAFGLALVYGDMTETLSPSADSWWPLVVTVTRSVVYLGLVLLLARSWGISSRSGDRTPDFASGRPPM